MIPVRLECWLECKDGSVDLTRDIDLPLIFPGMEIHCLFHDDTDGEIKVETLHYDHSCRKMIAGLGKLDEEAASFAEIRSENWYAGWTIEGFNALVTSGLESLDGPIPIGGRADG